MQIYLNTLNYLNPPNVEVLYSLCMPFVVYGSHGIHYFVANKLLRTSDFKYENLEI